MPLTIPEDDKPAFKMLLGLPEGQMRALIDALKASKPARYLRDLSQEVAASVPMEFADIYDVMKVLGFLSWLQSDEGADQGNLVPDVVAALKSDTALATVQGDWGRFADQLRQILQASSSLRITTKASEILSESERRLCPDGCRIVSEIRPIFMDDASAKPEAAVVVHTLKIAYHKGSGGDLEEFFVDLDREDLETMEYIIERALDKQRSLRSVVEGSGMHYLMSKSEADAE